MSKITQMGHDVRILLDGWTEKEMLRTYVHAGLIQQLRDEVVDSGGMKDENRSGKATEAKIPANEAALSLLHEVEGFVGDLVRWTGATRESMDIDNNLRWLLRVCQELGNPDDEAVGYLADGVAWVRSRIEQALDWAPRPKHLRFRCPRCNEATIRIQAEFHAWVAICSTCKTTWSGEPGLRDLAREVREKETT